METAEQEMPVAFSQMLQMFPNIPHDIIRMYVQRYSSDIDKCAQMLNLQSGKYAEINSFVLDNNKYLNEQNTSSQPSSQTVTDNNNAMHSPMVKNTINGDSEQTEYSGPHNPVHERGKLEPLPLHINVDEDDYVSHSWRPSQSADVQCSDFFLPSPLLENFHFDSNHVCNMNIQHGVSEFRMNPEAVKSEPCAYDMTSMHFYPMQNERAYGVNIDSHLRYQKHQMHAICFEVIKAKIELSDLKEEEEKLISELKEKLHSKSERDIGKLNEEIVQLRLECQCMCTEVDCSQSGQVLLGEVDEGYVRSRSSSQSEAHRNGPSAAQMHWPCPRCTYENDPANSACEMCRLMRPAMSRHLPPYPPPPATCYCHPKEEIQS